MCERVDAAPLEEEEQGQFFEEEEPFETEEGKWIIPLSIFYFVLYHSFTLSFTLFDYCINMMGTNKDD